MLGWNAFAEAAPAYAETGRSMLYEFGLGLGFLATVRPDIGPRVHPICPIMDGDGLYGFIVPGPKLEDLRRDGRYALHSETFPPPEQDDAFYVTGEVAWLDDSTKREAVTRQFLAERELAEPWPGFDDQTLVEFLIQDALVTLTHARGDLPAGHSVWHCEV